MQYNLLASVVDKTRAVSIPEAALLALLGFAIVILGIAFLILILWTSGKVMSKLNEKDGGHTVDDKEPKYGLSVSGIVHPDKVLSNATCKVGDKLVLTKPIGVGILNTAMKEGLVDEETSKIVVETMVHLNKYAAMSFDNIEVNSVTDVTGFGLLGHALEMAKASEVTIEIEANEVPIINRAIDMARMGIIPAGMYRNKEYIGKDVILEGIEEAIEDILHDPQTSGGLLVSVRADLADKLVEDMKKNGSIEAKIIGNVIDKKDSYIKVK